MMIAAAMVLAAADEAAVLAADAAVIAMVADAMTVLDQSFRLFATSADNRVKCRSDQLATVLFIVAIASKRKVALITRQRVLAADPILLRSLAVARVGRNQLVAMPVPVFPRDRSI